MEACGFLFQSVAALPSFNAAFGCWLDSLFLFIVYSYIYVYYFLGAFILSQPLFLQFFRL